MTELARGLELEEGDVHRFGNFVLQRNLVDTESELSGDQLLEAILKVDKETVEREVWDKDGLRRVLRDARTASSPPPSSQEETPDVVEQSETAKPNDEVVAAPRTESVDATTEK
jgi:hypothetical protein